MFQMKLCLGGSLACRGHLLTPEGDAFSSDVASLEAMKRHIPRNHVRLRIHHRHTPGLQGSRIRDAYECNTLFIP